MVVKSSAADPAVVMGSDDDDDDVIERRRRARIEEWISTSNQRFHEVPWHYADRREMQEILPDLFLGPFAVAVRSNLHVLHTLGITHIVCVRQVEERRIIRPIDPDTFSYLEVEISDRGFGSLLPHVRPVNAFVDRALSLGGRVLVHGNIGGIRSAALVTAYVMKEMQWTANAAFRFVQSRRMMVQLDEWMGRELAALEPILKADRQFSCSSEGGGGGRLLQQQQQWQQATKRSLEEEGVLQQRQQCQRATKRSLEEEEEGEDQMDAD